MADLKLTVDYSDLTGLIKTTDQTKQTLNLLARTFAKTGDVSNYMQGINRVVAAQKQLDVNSRMSRSQIMKLGNTFVQEVKYADQLQKSILEINSAMMGMNKQANRNGVVMQQVGYQVGDFLVQVQSGTSAFVAFGQQATQLAGILPLLGSGFMGLSTGALVALSAGLGIAIPLVTALGAAWMKSREANKEAAGSISDLEDRLKSLDDTIKDFVLTKRAAEAGVTVDELIGGEGIKQAEEDLAKARVQLEHITRTTEAMAQSGNLALRLLDFGAQSVEATKLASAVEAVSAAEERLYNLRVMAAQEEIDYVKEERQTLSDRLAIARLIVQHGEDSAEVKREELAQERRIYEAELRRNVASETTVQSLMATYDMTVKLAAENQNMADAAQEYSDIVADLDKEIGEAARKQLQFAGVDITTGVSEAAKAAAQLAANMGYSLTFAQSMINLRGGSSPTASRGNGMAEAQRRMNDALGITNQADLPEIDLPDWLTGKTSSGGGKTPAEMLEEYMSKLENETELKRAQVGLSEEAARTLELENQYKLRGVEVDSARIASIVSLEEETRKLTEAQEAAQKQQEFYKDTLLDGMESLVTGSKSVNEAFRDMIRNMLLDIYRQKVMEPIAQAGSSFLSSLFMANGGAFNKGVQMFADGGVVNAPTAFGHSGGVGVMGEAGPEAIMPLKRGPDGKLGVAGGSSPVNVTNVFNFSANGDDSVKRIIAQAAPQIAQMTQKQIMDSRRRGGQMKATFS